MCLKCVRHQNSSKLRSYSQEAYKQWYKIYKRREEAKQIANYSSDLEEGQIPSNQESRKNLHGEGGHLAQTLKEETALDRGGRQKSPRETNAEEGGGSEEAQNRIIADT